MFLELHELEEANLEVWKHIMFEVNNSLLKLRQM